MTAAAAAAGGGPGATERTDHAAPAATLRPATRAHRHTLGHEHDFEPQLGLPELLPGDERLLWQGSPDWKTLAVRAFHVRKLAIYFAAVLVLRAAFVIDDGGSLLQAVQALAWLAPLALLATGGMALMARLSARGAVYTITDKRVVMRIGIVLTVTFNLPYKRIAAAGLQLNADGSGDVPLALCDGERIAWLHLWPHARPWRIQRPEPMLRCVPDAAKVARLLTQAWAGATGQQASAAPAQPQLVSAPTATAGRPARQPDAVGFGGQRAPRPVRIRQPAGAGD